MRLAGLLRKASALHNKTLAKPKAAHGNSFFQLVRGLTEQAGNLKTVHDARREQAASSVASGKTWLAANVALAVRRNGAGSESDIKAVVRTFSTTVLIVIIAGLASLGAGTMMGIEMVRVCTWFYQETDRGVAF